MTRVMLVEDNALMDLTDKLDKIRKLYMCIKGLSTNKDWMNIYV
jgi:hypothetical protein